MKNFYLCLVVVFVLAAFSGCGVKELSEEVILKAAVENFDLYSSEFSNDVESLSEADVASFTFVSHESNLDEDQGNLFDSSLLSFVFQGVDYVHEGNVAVSFYYDSEDKEWKLDRPSMQVYDHVRRAPAEVSESELREGLAEYERGFSNMSFFHRFKGDEITSLSIVERSTDLYERSDEITFELVAKNGSELFTEQGTAQFEYGTSFNDEEVKWRLELISGREIDVELYEGITEELLKVALKDARFKEINKGFQYSWGDWRVKSSDEFKDVKILEQQTDLGKGTDEVLAEVTMEKENLRATGTIWIQLSHTGYSSDLPYWRLDQVLESNLSDMAIDPIAYNNAVVSNGLLKASFWTYKGFFSREDVLLNGEIEALSISNAYYTDYGRGLVLGLSFAFSDASGQFYKVEDIINIPKEDSIVSVLAGLTFEAEAIDVSEIEAMRDQVKVVATDLQNQEAGLVNDQFALTSDLNQVDSLFDGDHNTSFVIEPEVILTGKHLNWNSPDYVQLSSMKLFMDKEVSNHLKVIKLSMDGKAIDTYQLDEFYDGAEGCVVLSFDDAIVTQSLELLVVDADDDEMISLDEISLIGCVVSE